MAFDEKLATRLREIYSDRDDVTEKKMFGGIAFMVAGHMSCGVVGDVLMARVGSERHERALKRKHTRPMDFTGRPMKGFIYVDPPGISTARQLRSWIETSLEFIETLPEK